MSEFVQDLQETFGHETADNIQQMYSLLCLPQPENHDEYLASQEGLIVLLSQFGLVIRIEAKEESLSYEMGSGWQRVDDHPLVLQTLGSVDCGNALFEVCPAVPVGLNEADLNKLAADLKDDGINYYDKYGPNSGYIEHNGQKTPLVIDRLGVARLSTGAKTADQLMAKYGNPQGHFAPLKDAFSHAVNQPTMKSRRRSMQYFMNLCRQFKENGQLVCGWERSPEGRSDNLGVDHKTLEAQYAARNYSLKSVGL